MNVAITQRLKEVQAHQSQGSQLRIIPICGPSSDQPPYRLLDADSKAAVKVTEINESGQVPELRVKNTLEVMVYLMDGQELVGAKQNRILNTDVLVPAKSTISIPVSCVEYGRWHSISAQFSTGKTASYRTRAGKSDRVYSALKSSGRHDADQGAVWDEVEGSLTDSGTASSTSALADAYAQRDRDLRAFRDQLRMPENAVGLAVFQGKTFKGLDVFDRHSTLQFFWESLIDSYTLDWLGVKVEATADSLGEDSDLAEVRKILQKGAKGTWEPFASPGEGQDLRLKSRGYTGSTLVWADRTVLHLQMFPKLPPDRDSRDEKSQIYPLYGLG